MMENISNQESTTLDNATAETADEQVKTPIIEDEHHADYDELAETEAEQDYSAYTKEQLLEVSNELFKENSFRKVDGVIRQLKTEIDRHNREERETALNKFAADGGQADDFEFKQDETVEKFYANVKALREKKSKYFADIEKKKHKNLEAKHEIISEVKALLESNNTTKTAIERLRELQHRWRETGAVPPQNAEVINESYKALVDRFYSQKNMESELIDLDRRRNLTHKLEICDKAEALTKVENLNEAVNQLNKLHEEFKTVGPVPRDEQEHIWQRFKLASDKIYEARRTYLEETRKALNENMRLKQDLCLKIETYPEFNSDKITDWNQKTREVLALQTEWDKIGPAPREVAKEINKQFWTNFKTFFNNKSKFFEKIEKARDENLNLKTELCLKAEAAKESFEWDETTDLLKKYQEDWKTIGPVPEAQRDSIYERFKAACDAFFERKRNRKNDQDKEFEHNLTKKMEIIAQIEALTKAKDGEVAKVEAALDEYLKVGFVPRKNMNTIQDKLAKTVDAYVNSLPISNEDKEKQRFELQVSAMGGGANADRKFFKKEQTIRKRMSAIEDDISLWRNNLEFFANSKTAEKLRKDYNQKIAEAQKELDGLKAQIKMFQEVK